MHGHFVCHSSDSFSLKGHELTDRRTTFLGECLLVARNNGFDIA